MVAALVLGGALAAGHRHRVYDAVILKTLGATRLRLLAAYAIEYLLLGAATALFGVLAGSLAGWLIVTDLMHLRFAWLPLPALAAASAQWSLRSFWGCSAPSRPWARNRPRC